MMSNKIKKVRDALKTVAGLKIYHYWRDVKTPPYVIWYEYGEGQDCFGDNKKEDASYEGQIHYFTKTEYDVNTDAIETALNTEDICFALESVQFEDDNSLIHFTWSFEVK